MSVKECIDRQVQEELRTLLIDSPKICYIFSVPRHLSAANEAAFTPLVVSIGPLHRHADHLQHARPHKLRYLESFLRRAFRDLHSYCDIIITNLTKIQDSYADPGVCHMDSNELVMMVLVDAAFLIELFRRSRDLGLIEENDQMFRRPRMVERVRYDLLLEDNQLPFFILQELYDAAYGRQEGAPDFMSIACDFLGVALERINRSGCMHFLDLLRDNHLPPPYFRREYRGAIWRPKPNMIAMCKTAMALWEAGVKFKVHEDPNCGLLGIEFDEHHGTLMIPRIDIQDHTELLLRNMALHEQLHYFADSYIIDYILFLDFLIRTPADVALLVKHDIIVNRLGSDERVGELFSGLSRQLGLRSVDFYYTGECSQFNAFYRKRWNHYLAVLKLKYFNHPWAVVAVGYAVVMLLLAVIQVVTGVMSVTK